MINVITKNNNKSDKKLMDLESFFNSRVLSKSKEFTDLDFYIMKEVDGATIIDLKLGTVKTRFGVTNLRHLSTGCKVVLSYNYILKHMDKYSGVVINITEASGKALVILFDLADKFKDNSTIFLLEHQEGLLDIEDRDYLVNGRRTRSLIEGVYYND